MIEELTYDEANRLPDHIQLMSDKLYRRKEAIVRVNNPPNGMLEGGKPLLISMEETANNSNRTTTRYLAAWHIKESTK